MVATVDMVDMVDMPSSQPHLHGLHLKSSPTTGWAADIEPAVQ